MGLKLRYNLFYGVTPQDVYGAYTRFHAQRNHILADPTNDNPRSYFELYEPNNKWVILNWDGGWEWIIRREAQLFVSEHLQCLGFLIFVYDGTYWGYELFRDGVVTDRFLRTADIDEINIWFPDDSCVGNADIVAEQLAWLEPGDIAPYLIKRNPPPVFRREPPPGLTEQEAFPEYLEERRTYREYFERVDVPPRPGDEYKRFHSCAVLNFLRLLNVTVEVRQGITLLSPIWRQFSVKPTI